MAEHDWKHLLDDPEIEGIVARVYKGPGRRYYGKSSDSLALDDLESWLWDQAVDIAMNYTGPPAGAPNPLRHWHATLYLDLTKGIQKGWHYKTMFGNPESDKRQAGIATQPSIQDLVERHGDTFTTRLTRDDPLSMLLLIERLEQMVDRRAEPIDDGTCLEALCHDTIFVARLCSRHYQQHRQHWVTPECTVPDCTKPIKATGLCSKHYTDVRNAQAGPCAEADCTQPARTRGLCRAHYSHARDVHGDQWAAERAARPAGCITPGCTARVRAKSLCSTHYDAYKRQRRRERDHQ